MGETVRRGETSRRWLAGRWARGLLTTVLVGAACRPAGAEEARLLDAFRQKHGAAWRLDHDPTTRRPRRLFGGAIAWAEAAGPRTDAADRAVVERAREFLRENEELLRVHADGLRVTRDGVLWTRDGGLGAVHFDVTADGVPVAGGRVTCVLRRGRLTGVHVVGSAPLDVDARPRLSMDEARVAGMLVIQGRGGDGFELLELPRLVILPRDGVGVLAWIVSAVHRDRPARLTVEIDAREGSVLAVRDETVAACEEPRGRLLRRVVGGVRPRRADEPERTEILPHASVGGTVAGPDGLFVPPAGSPLAELRGPAVRIECVGCTPAVAAAPVDERGDADFGSGGVDHVGNGTSTPAARAVFRNVQLAVVQAARWSALPFLDDAIRARVNVPADCNAYWDGRALNFMRSSARCANTAEVRDVVAHEWGHALDEHDGVPPSSVFVDAASGEAAADVVAMLLDRDACIGDSFFRDPGDHPSSACSGIRDLDERSAGHVHGDPATLSVANAARRCPPSATYRGPLGLEGHCEGEILGQAIWHLIQGLRTGMSYADGSPLPGGALPEEDAWDTVERLFHGARLLTASYLPSHLQSLGMSAHEALLLADDEGDGLANGTPHAGAIREAFTHHGIAEAFAPLPTAATCGGPPVPTVAVETLLDEASGAPASRVSWSTVGAASYEVLRRDADVGPWLLLARRRADEESSLVDRGVLAGRLHAYRVVAIGTDGCRRGSEPIFATASGPVLDVASVRVGDPPPGGDGDGSAGTGESVELWFVLENAGDLPFTRPSATVAATSTGLALAPTVVPFASLAPGGRTAEVGPFGLEVLPEAPADAWLDVSVVADEGCGRASTRLRLMTPDVLLDSWVLRDGRSGEGSWQPGETVSLRTELANAGRAAARGVTARLSAGAPVPGVSLDRTVLSHPDLPAGASLPDPAPVHRLTADASVPPRTRVPLELEILLDGEPHRRFSLTAVVGGFPEPVLEWRYTPEWFHPLNVPLVVQLTDDDGDGHVTAADVPDVVAMSALGPDDVAVARPTLVAISGTGQLLWTRSGPCTDVGPFAAAAAGDIDGDGRNEIVTAPEDDTICAITSDGNLLWRSAPEGTPNPTSRVPQLWDLDGDGRVEVIGAKRAFRGVDGSVAWESPFASLRSLVLDLDLDGSLEVLKPWRAVRADGSAHPTPDVVPSGTTAGIAVNLDDDPFAEIVHSGPVIAAYDHDMRLLWSRDDLPATDPANALPCAADVDGDGRAEIVFAARSTIHLFDDDGTTVWTAPYDDRTGSAGCSIFDFEADGRLELTCRDHETLQVLDLATGELLWSTPLKSGTGLEFPVVADVDGDGRAEIVVQGHRTTWDDGGIWVYGSPLWAPARRIWNQESYTVTNVREDGSIPPPPRPSWLEANDARAQHGACPTLTPVDVVVQQPTCDGDLACFEVSLPEGAEATEIRWTFGDGAPQVTAERPCHAFPGPGRYRLEVSVEGADGCVVELTELVDVAQPPSVDFAVPAACAGALTCLTASVVGGTPPHSVTWEVPGAGFAMGETTCWLLPDGTHEVTAFIEDARGCTAATTLPLLVLDAGTLPELSPRELRVTRAGGDLLLTFDAAGTRAGALGGDLRALRTRGYTHAALECSPVAGVARVATPVRDAYFLVGARDACDAVTVEGSLGRDSAGALRPSTAALGSTPCP